MHAYQEMPSVRFFEIKGILPTHMSLARKMETVQHKVNYKDHHQFQILKEVIVPSHHLGMTEVQRVEVQRVEEQRVEEQRVEEQRVEVQRVEVQRVEVQRVEVQRVEVKWWKYRDKSKGCYLLSYKYSYLPSND